MPGLPSRSRVVLSRPAFAPDDWTSGEKIWLLDLIAPNRQMATAVLANFKQIAGDNPVSNHPIVALSVDAGVLEKMRAPE